MKVSTCSRYVLFERKHERAVLTVQVFVANPNKSMAVQRILISNREKLLRFLPSFLDDRTEDEQFIDEKSFLIRQIEQLPSQPVLPPTTA